MPRTSHPQKLSRRVRTRSGVSRRDALASILGAAAIPALGTAKQTATPVAKELLSTRLASLDYRPDPSACYAAFKYLGEALANTPATRFALIRTLKAIAHIQTLLTWNYEYVNAEGWLEFCAANFALYANFDRRNTDQAFASGQYKLAKRHLIEATRRFSLDEAKHDSQQATRHFRSLLPEAPKAYPGLANSTGKPYQLLWGDLQVHTALSYDAYLGPLFNQRFAHSVMGFDFIALTDHAFGFGSADHPTFKADAWTMYAMLVELVRRSDKADSALTLTGLEWGGRFAQGHRHIVFAPDSQPQFPYAITASNSATITELWASLARNAEDALTIPHHTGYTENAMGSDLRHQNSVYQRLIEITSDNGCFEFPGDALSATNGGKNASGRTVSDALRQGQRLGIVGGSDGHLGIPGLYVPQTTGFGGVPGFTAVYAESNAPGDIYAALKARRCYATEAQRIGLAFSINGAPMGSEISIAPQDALNIEISASAADQIAEISLLENEEIARKFQVNALEFKTSVSIPGEAGTGPALRRANASAREQLQFRIRLVLKNGRRAWSSPVWVDFRV